LSPLLKTIFSFHVVNKRKHNVITVHVARLNIAILETSFGFSVQISKYFLNLKNYSANFVENCKIYSKELLVNEINGKINSDKFGRSYDDVYFVVAF